MIVIKNKQAIEKMAVAGTYLAEIMQHLTTYIAPGMTTMQINDVVEQQLKRYQLTSTMKGYMGYRHVTCISLNEEVVHGVPSSTRFIAEGDLVKVDVAASWKGYCADMARCFFVGDSMPIEIQTFIQTATQALDRGIEQMYEGNHLTDISSAIEKVIVKAGYGIVRDFAGHGIGKRMHEDPEILNYGSPGQGPVLREGMAFAIEPMITVGTHEVYVANDGWTVKTRDGKHAAHVEDTVVVTAHGPRVLTRLVT